MKETNMENYRGEIEETGYRFGIVDGKIVNCWEVSCNSCAFGKPDCVRKKIEWLMSEYKPEPVLTAREKHFVEFAQKGWLARTEDERLIWHQDKPFKSNIMWFCHANHFCLNGFADMFPFITWGDEEPWAVEELRKLKCENE